jgi:ABC-type glycerol-3-phosphate transport system permease component
VARGQGEVSRVEGDGEDLGRDYLDHRARPRDRCAGLRPGNNSLLGLALTYISFSLPYALWILRAFFQSIPVELEHAALIDGANRAQALTYVVMPLALPGIIATSIFTFIVAWNDFLFALVLIGKDELKTLAIGINEFFHMAVVDWGLIMAAGVMVTIPALIFFVAIQRYLIAGWGAGGMKG